jgi:hypothetical protein
LTYCKLTITYLYDINCSKFNINGPSAEPYAPGAGTPPPELAGRDDLIERSAIALDRIRAGRAARSFVLYGLRGVGKTVLLNRAQRDADARGFATAKMEAPEDRSLPALLAPNLRVLLLKLSRGEKVRSAARQALRALAGFASALRLKYQDLEIGLDIGPSPAWPTAEILKPIWPHS